MDYNVTGFQNGLPIEIPLRVLSEHRPQIPNRFRLIYIQSGEGIVLIGGLQLHFLAPSVLCLPIEASPCIFSSNHSVVTKEIVFHPLFINPDYGLIDPELLWIQAFLKRSNAYHGLLQLDTLTAHRVETLIEAVDSALTMQKDDYWPCRSKSYLLECLLIIDRLLSQYDLNMNGYDQIQNPKINTTDPLISDVIMFLHTHYNETITLDDLTQQFNINRTTLNAQFKLAIGKTMIQYLIEYRLYMAQLLLTYTLLPIAEIMERIGFKDLTHFNRSFKQRTKLTPTAYREIYCKKA